MAGENEANVAGPYSGACPACVNGSGTAHVRAYGTDENVVVVKGREKKGWGEGGRVWVKERWGRAGHRIRRQGSSGLKNTPISGVICASIFGRVARTRVFALRLCKHRADFARQLPWTNSRVEKHSYKHTRGGGEGQRKRIWKRRGGESFRRFEPLTDLFGRERGGGVKDKGKRGERREGRGEGEFFGEKPVESRAVSKARTSA